MHRGGRFTMGLAGFITTIILLAIQFWGALRLSANLVAYKELETLILIIGLLVSIAALIGLALNTRWGWPLTLIVFSASLANFVWLFWMLGVSITVAGGMIVAAFSMLIAFIAIDLWEPPQKWEPEPVTEVSEPVDTTAKSTKKKSTRKKSTRKKRKKRT
ncbi:hypothetical protein GF342_04740 [Candidatus Woesearchaeota archaeon]|nr:hypothetical protein [Candidatus Woesearchaeota archaeon]